MDIFSFFKKLKPIISGANYMKKNQLNNGAGLLANTNFSLLLHETKYSRMDQVKFVEDGL